MVSRYNKIGIGELEGVMRYGTMFGVQGFQQCPYTKMVIGKFEGVVLHVTMLDIRGFQRCLDTTKWSLVTLKV